MSARQPLPNWVTIVLMPVLNVLLAFIIGGLAVAIIGENPLDAMWALFYGAFGTGMGWGFTLHYATNFIFTGLAVAIAFKAGMFNIGGEGQAYVAGLGAIMVALWLDQSHWTLVLLGSTLAAMMMGSLWAIIPAWLQAKRGSHIVITTIMFNFIASAFMSYMLAQVITAPGANAETRTINEQGRLPLMSDWFDAFQYSPLNITFFLWHRCAHLHLCADLAHQVGIQNPYPWCQQGSCALCWYFGGFGDHHCHGHFRRVGRSDGG